MRGSRWPLLSSGPARIPQTDKTTKTRAHGAHAMTYQNCQMQDGPGAARRPNKHRQSDEAQHLPKPQKLPYFGAFRILMVEMPYAAPFKTWSTEVRGSIDKRYEISEPKQIKLPPKSTKTRVTARQHSHCLQCFRHLIAYLSCPTHSNCMLHHTRDGVEYKVRNAAGRVRAARHPPCQMPSVECRCASPASLALAESLDAAPAPTPRQLSGCHHPVDAALPAARQPRANRTCAAQIVSARSFSRP